MTFYMHLYNCIKICIICYDMKNRIMNDILHNVFTIIAIFPEQYYNVIEQ